MQYENKTSRLFFLTAELHRLVPVLMEGTGNRKTVNRDALLRVQHLFNELRSAAEGECYVPKDLVAIVFYLVDFLMAEKELAEDPEPIDEALGMLRRFIRNLFTPRSSSQDSELV